MKRGRTGGDAAGDSPEVAKGPRSGSRLGRRAEGRTRGGGRAGASVATVFPALVQLALVARVPGLAAALGLPPRVEEAAAAIEALQVTGSGSRSCRKGTEPGKEGNSGVAGHRVLGPGVGTWEGHEHTIWRGRGRGHGHTGAIVQPLPVGTGADWPTGAQQAEPLTLLAVTGVGHCRCGQGVGGC